MKTVLNENKILYNQYKDDLKKRGPKAVGTFENWKKVKIIF
jgi:hypothetical protein